MRKKREAPSVHTMFLLLSKQTVKRWKNGNEKAIDRGLWCAKEGGKEEAILE